MQVRDVERGFMIKLERGERVMETLTAFCEARGVRSGTLFGVGALKNAELGYYDLSKKKYFFYTLPEDREVASFSGNVAQVDGKPFIHAHAVLSDMTERLACKGGHLKEAEVAVTLEVYLTPFNVTLSRKQDDAIGLKLLHL